MSFASTLLCCDDRSTDSRQRSRPSSAVDSLPRDADDQVTRQDRLGSVVPKRKLTPTSLDGLLKNCSSLNEALDILDSECVARELPSETAKQFLRFYEEDEIATLSQIEALDPGAVKTAVIASIGSAIHEKYGIDAAKKWIVERDFEVEKDAAIFCLIYKFYPPEKFTSSELKVVFTGFQSKRLESEMQLRFNRETKATSNR